MLSKLRIEPTDNAIQGFYRAYIDNNEMQHCASLTIDLEPGCIPQANFTLNAAPSFDGDANVILEFTPETVGQAVIILRDELLKHGAYYKAFCDSIQSALRDMENPADGMFDDELAEHIMKRVIGEE